MDHSAQALALSVNLSNTYGVCIAVKKKAEVTETYLLWPGPSIPTAPLSIHQFEDSRRCRAPLHFMYGGICSVDVGWMLLAGASVMTR